jgi:hypothetical protein
MNKYSMNREKGSESHGKLQKSVDSTEFLINNIVTLVQENTFAAQSFMGAAATLKLNTI